MWWLWKWLLRVQKSRPRASKQSLHEAAASLLLPQEQARTGAGVVMSLAAGARAQLEVQYCDQFGLSSVIL
jgi:hypothetical protein